MTINLIQALAHHNPKESPQRKELGPDFRTYLNWTPDEDAELIACWNLVPITRIAKRLHRTSAAVRGRYRKVCKQEAGSWNP